MRFLVGAFVGLLFVAACSAPSIQPFPASPGTSSLTSQLTSGAEGTSSGVSGDAGIPLDCNAIGDELPTPDRLVVLGQVALPSLRAPALQTARQPDHTSPLLAYFAKTGLGFKRGSHWKLRVAPEHLAHLRIGWGSPAVPTTLVVPPTTCSPASGTGWLWYPGGFWTDRPGCYAVVVQVADQSRRVAVGVGAPCPAQKPPPEPSDR
ncbi:hypothetical protein ACWEOW_09715 [Monashia sp. NPDC004114]